MIGRMRIAIVGFGLIGGSIARALRAPGAATAPLDPVELVAWSRHRRDPRMAVDAGILDDAPGDLEATVDGAGLVILAAPPLASLDLVREFADPLRGALGADATLTDVASTKQTIMLAADRLALRFVGGHPMAGREATGFAAAEADLFVDRPWVICPGAHADAEAVARVEALARACGAHPIAMDPAIHDRATAAVSHVPLIVAAALVEAMTGDSIWPEAAPLAAGGWQAMTRLARGDPAMGAGIALTNGPAVADGLREVRAAIDDWIATLDGDPVPADLEARFRAARDRLGS